MTIFYKKIGVNNAIKVLKYCKKYAKNVVKMTNKTNILSIGKDVDIMKKGRFFKRFNYKLIEEYGYLDMEKGLAYSRDTKSKEWVSTDIYTGLKAYSGKTKKEVIETTEKLYQNICDQRESERYKKYNDQFEMLLDGRFGEVIKIED